MKNINVMKNVVKEEIAIEELKWNKIIKILKEVFEIEFPKQMNDENLNDIILNNLRRGKDITELKIDHNYYGYANASIFDLKNKLIDYSYKHKFFIFRKQINFLGENINDIISSMSLSQRNISKEIITNSLAIETFKQKCVESGNTISINSENMVQIIIHH